MKKNQYLQNKVSFGIVKHLMENVLQVLRLVNRHHCRGRDLNSQKTYIQKFKSGPSASYT